MTIDRSFSDRLLSQEQMTPALQERYEREVKAMFEKTLNPVQKFFIGLSAAMGAAFFVGFAYVAITAPKGFPTMARGVFAIAALFGLAWAVLSGMVVRKRSMNLKLYPNVIAGLTWGVVTLIAVSLMVMSGSHPDAVRSVYMVLTGLVFLIFGAVNLIMNSVEQSEYRTRERLLRMELRMAEIAESVAKSQERAP